MKLKFVLPKGQRFMNQMDSVTVFTNDDKSWWWNNTLKRWELWENRTPDCEFSSHCRPVRSVRRFKKLVKEWSTYMPKGTEFYLYSKFEGADVSCTI